VDNASALPTDPQDQKTKASVNLIASTLQQVRHNPTVSPISRDIRRRIGTYPGHHSQSPGGSARAVGAGRGCGDGASAGWGVIVGAAFEAPAIVSGFDYVAVVSEAIEQSGRHLGVCKDARPFAEGEIG
jgi:hypothetical protein